MTTESTNPAMPRVRYRINVTSHVATKDRPAQCTFDCTCEIEGPVEFIGGEVPSSIALGKIQEAILLASNQLVAALQAKYPMGVE